METIKRSSSRTRPDAATRRRASPRTKPAAEAEVHTAAGDRADVTPEERHRMIAAEAYLQAERRGFAPGSELEDWLRAEREVDERLGQCAARAYRANRNPHS